MSWHSLARSSSRCKHNLGTSGRSPLDPLDWPAAAYKYQLRVVSANTSDSCLKRKLLPRMPSLAITTNAGQATVTSRLVSTMVLLCQRCSTECPREEALVLSVGWRSAGVVACQTSSVPVTWRCDTAGTGTARDEAVQAQTGAAPGINHQPQRPVRD